MAAVSVVEQTSRYEDLVRSYMGKKLAAKSDRSQERVQAIAIGAAMLLEMVMTWNANPAETKKLDDEQKKTVARFVRDIAESIPAMNKLKIEKCCFCDQKNVTLEKCTGCRIAMYCGPVCQTLDWDNHKKICLYK